MDRGNLGKVRVEVHFCDPSYMEGHACDPRYMEGHTCDPRYMEGHTCNVIPATQGRPRL